MFREHTNSSVFPSGRPPLAVTTAKARVSPSCAEGDTGLEHPHWDDDAVERIFLSWLHGDVDFLVGLLSSLEPSFSLENCMASVDTG